MWGWERVSEFEVGDIGVFKIVNKKDLVERKKMIMKKRGVVDNVRILRREEEVEFKVMLEEFMWDEGFIF